MIEAMRCGTPVIAWDCGSVPEVIDEGVSGFVVDNLDDAVRAVKWVGELDRRRLPRGVRIAFQREADGPRLSRGLQAAARSGSAVIVPKHRPPASQYL